MTRLVPVTVLVMLLTIGRAAHAQGTGTGTGSLPNGATITFAELKIHENGSKDLVFPKTDPDSIWHYFNLAHCQCSQAMPSGFNEGTFAYLLQLQNPMGTPVSRPLEVWVGSNCSMDTARPPSTTATCHRIDSAGLPSVDELTSPGNYRPEIPVFDFMTPTPGATACLPASQSSTLWAAVDTDMNSIPDYFVPQQLTTDSLAPPLPSNFHAAGGEGAIEISWKPPPDASDVFAYQALCAVASTDGPGKTSGRPPQRYMTATTLCGLPPPPDMLIPKDIATPPDAPDAGGPVTITGGLADLDPKFLCGDQLSATASSLRIDGLQNGVAYKVVLLVVDKYQNTAGVYFTSTVTPVPSTDFWEDLHGRGSKVEGGLCLLAETYGDDSGLTNTLRAFRDDTLGSSRVGRWLTELYYATLGKLGSHVHGSIALRIVAAVVLAPVVVFALLWYWLTLPGVLGLLAAAWLWRRRRRFLVRLGRRILAMRTTRVATALAVIALGAGRAHAGGYQPYWENGDATADSDAAASEPETVTWHVGIRIGPYVPDIDKQIGVTPGPYSQMFGGARALPMLDVDRVLWSGFGQVGVGLSLGYMQKTAHTFALQSLPSDTDRMRSADTNTFRLIPIALTGTYRFTWLDDQYGIPVVPYARAGLGYYVWWLSVSDGSLAQVCKNGGTEPMCDQNTSLGASLGVQGSIGLAIRAERIDAQAAMSMKQSGIQHAGIYAELSAAKVDGFGSDKKLSVGARTWFAGVDFEF